MSTYFTYSVLQYKHNLILGEVLNVGILFHFPNEKHFEFVKGDGYRAKSIYPNFDSSLFNAYLRNITQKVKQHVDLFNNEYPKDDFIKYINQYILAEDAAGLIFSNAVTVKNVFSTTDKAIKEYSKLLLPGIITEKPTTVKHNESFIIKTFQGYIQDKDKTKEIEKRLQRNQFIKTKHFNIKFELSYQAKTNKFIKPLSFDLTDDIAIQSKAAITYSHLVDLIDYAKTNKTSFDFLVAPPQDKSYNRDYQNALDFIDSAKTSKKLITQDKWEDYSQQTFDLLHNN